MEPNTNGIGSAGGESMLERLGKVWSQPILIRLDISALHPMFPRASMFLSTSLSGCVFLGLSFPSFGGGLTPSIRDLRYDWKSRILCNQYQCGYHQNHFPFGPLLGSKMRWERSEKSRKKRTKRDKVLLRFRGPRGYGKLILERRRSSISPSIAMYRKGCSRVVLYSGVPSDTGLLGHWMEYDIPWMVSTNVFSGVSDCPTKTKYLRVSRSIIIKRNKRHLNHLIA